MSGGIAAAHYDVRATASEPTTLSDEEEVPALEFADVDVFADVHKADSIDECRVRVKMTEDAVSTMARDVSKTAARGFKADRIHFDNDPILDNEIMAMVRGMENLFPTAEAHAAWTDKVAAWQKLSGACSYISNATYNTQQGFSMQVAFNIGTQTAETNTLRREILDMLTAAYRVYLHYPLSSKISHDLPRYRRGRNRRERRAFAASAKR